VADIKLINKSEEYHRAIFEYAPNAFYLNDIQGHFLDGNRVAEELIGYKKEELLGKNFLQLNLISHDQVVKAAKLLAKSALGLSTGPDEFRLKKKDGSEVIVEIRTFPFKIENQNLILGIAVDLTKRKKTEEDLSRRNSELENMNKIIAAREAKIRAILDTSFDGFWTADLEGHFLDINNAYCQLIGYSRAELLKMRISDIEAVEKPEETKERIQKIIKIGHDRFESVHRRKDGTLVDIEISVNYTNEDGGRMFVFVRDVSQRNRKEKELEKYTKDLERMNSLMVGRELKMAELKKVIEELKKKGSDNKDG
jgi:two-component system, cell cycle sensor histidine kinase and response regulator CckA